MPGAGFFRRRWWALGWPPPRSWLSVLTPRCFGPVCPSPIVHEFLKGVLTWDLTPVALLLAVALLFKVIFVDYLADVALYTSSDENSAF